MSQNNEDDLKIIKEYKEKKLKKLHKERKDNEQFIARAERKKTDLSVEIAELESKDAEGMSRRNHVKHRREVRSKKKFLEDLNDDISTAVGLDAEYHSEIEPLKVEIQQIEAELAKLKNKKSLQEKKLANKKQNPPVQQCPKKCRIENVVVQCEHEKSIEVPPYEGEVPTLHVLASSDESAQDIISVKFGGSCDHGKSQSADDAEKHEIADRTGNADQYCPRAKVTSIHHNGLADRPSGLKIAANCQPVEGRDDVLKFLISSLVFGREDEKVSEYEIDFTTCQGDLPYKAKVLAHPPRSWNIGFSLGYESTVKKETHTEPSLPRVASGYESYDTVEAEGAWGCKVSGAFEYDTWEAEVEKKLDLDELLKSLGGTWPLIQKLETFFKPITGFCEQAKGYALDGVTATQGKSKRKRGKSKAGTKEAQFGREVCTINIHGPKLEINGSYKAIELDKPSEIAGEGKLVIGLFPLFGITGEVDILQILARTYGGPFGKYLIDICNMSYGTVNDKGEVDPTKNYIKTTLTLRFKGTASVGGSLGFEFKQRDGLTLANDDSKVEGFIGLGIAGEAAINGQFWKLVFAAGATFKTTDESFEKESGIEIDFKPVVIAQKTSWVGSATFNGLAILWSVYVKSGKDAAASEKNKAKAKAGRSYGPNKNVTVEKDKIEFDYENANKAILFKKRHLLGHDDSIPLGT